MSTIQFVPTTERFPKVSETKTQIYQLEGELREVTLKEELRLQTRGALLGVAATEENERRMNEVEAEIETLQQKKTRLTDRIEELKKMLPIVTAEAHRSEAALKAAHEDVKRIKAEIEDLGRELNESLKEPMDLIEKRKQAIHRLQKAGDEASTLNSRLRWHPLEKVLPPGEPEMLRKLTEILWRPLRTDKDAI